MRTTKRLTAALVLVLSATMVTGCAGSYYGSAAYDYDYQGRARLVYVGPDLWVVERHPDAVFYNDGYYWRYSRGAWFRSYSLREPWARVHYEYIPYSVRRIDRPYRYSRYVAPRGATVRYVRVPEHQRRVRTY